MPFESSESGRRVIGDVGLLSPVTVGTDAELSDAAVLEALVAAEVALTRAWADVGVAPRPAADEISTALGWRGPGEGCAWPDAPLEQLAADAVAGGNPVIPLVGLLRDRVAAEARTWVHRGATSQDVLDSALMLLAHRSATATLGELRAAAASLERFAAEHRDEVAAARTLTQHAVPTTVGLRAAGWLRGIRRAADHLDRTIATLPAQLAGAGGTLASFVQIGGVDAARALPAAFAAQLALAVPDGPWHTQRWPVTELGDALTRALDALGVVAADVATLSRTEVGELAERSGGGSSAMPQKRNPARSVLIRSAALRAPGLAATLHTAAALAVDERPDGAWHAEWPTLRELLRLARGASAHAAVLLDGLCVDPDAVARNLALTRGLIVSERLAIVLGPVLGAERVRGLVAKAGRSADLAELLRAEPDLASAGIDVDEILDPAHYLGLAGDLVDGALAADALTAERPASPERPEPPGYPATPEKELP
ncbi:lyase family protein [Leucobacter rhizosphaerae]|uniref:Lyase family protein n=1 Tax=Leucobacter rhizosphaerae TaxID=2932245 RepID=A0ABY4FS22_9MICO|nr:lyase family protein [Leucobacter rhizosphaerae]UOQ59089.1 lyase family protein [Leucobacter rhizosphaerae]